jgi:rfaE bifunctional protein nucleotidyltransferase chain/domain
MVNKTYSLKELKKKIMLLKKDGLCIGLANGCFDLLHMGHLKLLDESKQTCDFLIIALNSDKSVKLLKGDSRPIDNQNIRIKKLLNTDFVDAIILFDENTPLKIIQELLPDILIKGSDYEKKAIVGADTVIKNGGSIKIIKLLSGYSTTKIINQRLSKQ